MYDWAIKQLAEIASNGLTKKERSLVSAQSSIIEIEGEKQQRQLINMCANNYLGLANDSRLIEAAKQSLQQYGFGAASVRFICGTFAIHKELEDEVSDYLGYEDTILFPSCFDANAGLFEVFLTAEDAIFSDALNHASIIDGVRLCKAKRYRYENRNLNQLEQQLKEANNSCKKKMIVSDGVFSMDGIIADVKGLVELAEKYDAALVIDDSHAVGVIGPQGRGSPALFDVSSKVDMVTGTFGKALGGGSGGYVSGKKAYIDLLRQRARPYLFSNAIPPMIAKASLEGVKIAKTEEHRRTTINNHANKFRSSLSKAGFTLIPGEHPIIPIMTHEATLATEMADLLDKQNIYVSPFFYPVVPVGKARIRTQISAAMTDEHLQQAIEAIISVGKSIKLIQ